MHRSVGPLRVRDVIAEDEMRVLLVAETEDNLSVELEIPATDAAWSVDATVRLLGTMRGPGLPTCRGRLDLVDVGPVAVFDYFADVATSDLLDGPLPSLAAVLAIIERSAGALQVAHARGVCHRDVALAHIRLDVDGAVRVTDWTAAATGKRRRRLTMDVAAYLAPEVLQRRDVWAGDVYALGVCLLELACGQRVTPASVAVARTAAIRDILSARDPVASSATLEGLITLIRTMLAEDWERRPLAMEVVRRAGDLAHSFRGTDLPRFAGDRVPAIFARRQPARGWAGRRLVEAPIAAGRAFPTALSPARVM